MHDYYQILGCEYGCDLEQLKSAYRQKVKDNHPDHGGHEADFVLIKDGFDILSDPGRRADYDSRLGLRKLNGRFYRITLPTAIRRPLTDLYDDIKTAVKQAFDKRSRGILFIEVDADRIKRNTDDIIVLAPEIEKTCPSCIGLGGWMGNCPNCRGSGIIKMELLLPFECGNDLEAGDKTSFSYDGYEVELRIT